MKTYETVSEAVNALNERGYSNDFSLVKTGECIFCHTSNRSLNPEEFIIDEVHRFDGGSDPGDEMIVYAISSPQLHLKGILVNAFGTYSDPEIYKIVSRLKLPHPEKIQPIRRSDELIKLSREHHHALLLAWKIRTGIAKGVDAARIEKYVDWFYQNLLKQHMEIEDKFVFTTLEEDNPNRIKAEAQHGELRELFGIKPKSKEVLSQIQELLNQHVRFEERALFNEIQKTGNLNILQNLQNLSKGELFIDNETDPFWQ